MKNIIVSVVLLLMGGFVLSVFNGAHAESLDGAKRLSKAEVVALLSGNTVEWTTGAGFYKPDGNLYYKWKGSEGWGEWRVNDDGVECWTVPKWWGQAEKCFLVWHTKGDAYVIQNLRKLRIVKKPLSIVSKGNNLSKF